MSTNPKNDLTGRKIGRLTVIKLASTHKYYGNKTVFFWDCLCECGKTISVAGNKLTLKDRPTKSCGCIQIEKAIEQLNIINENIELQHPFDIKMGHIFVEKHNKGFSYNDGNISLDKFKELSQQPCFYCKKERCNAREYFPVSKSPLFKEEDYIIRYNGLDRIDNSLPHNLDNVVVACGKCNSAKCNFPQDYFIEKTRQIANLERKEFVFGTIAKEEAIPKMLEAGWLIERKGKIFRTDLGAQMAKAHYIFKDGMTKEEFFLHHKDFCYYCGIEPSSFFNYIPIDGGEKIKYYYHGYDRVDSSKTHTPDNVVPACYDCNWMKGNMSQAEFLAWAGQVSRNLSKV